MRFQAFVPVALALAIAQGAYAADAPQPAPTTSGATGESSDSSKQNVVVQGAAATETPEPPKVTCHMENDIGSMRMHKVCTKVQTDAERLQLQDSLRNNLPNNNLTHPAAGSGH
jgi:hypothetical protein